MNWKEVLELATNGNPAPERVVRKTEAEWRQQLTEEQFYITRLHGTERPFTGEYCEAHDPGKYECRCCGELLFDSAVKFESHSGWPSFTEPAKPGVIKYILDTSHGMKRVEVVCNICEAHLGHVFPDGPKPTGLRFCINSASIRLQTSH